MSKIKNKNTKSEIIVRQYLWAKKHRYRLHYKKLPGKPDLVFIGRKKAVFINGCFWHKHTCKYFIWPKTNVEFWKNKITETVKRDKRNYEEIYSKGWDILILWECEILKDFDSVSSQLNTFLL